MNNWNRSLKIVLSVFVTLTSMLIGFYIHIPITRVDALVSKISGVPTAYTEEVTTNVVSATVPEPEDIIEFSSTLIELPDSYYTKPAPAPITPSQSQYSAATGQNIFPATTTSISQASVMSSITIPKIGLNNVPYTTGSMGNIADIDTKLLQGPVTDTLYAVDACNPNSHTYLMGHSEPAYGWQASYPGAYIFAQLHTLTAGDRITITNQSGTTCNYEVTGWDKAVTDDQDRVPIDVFNSVMFPDTSQHGVLSIQTCQQGSATVRLILRARLLTA